MKREYFLIWIMSALLVGCNADALHSGKKNCREITDQSEGKCTANLKYLSSNYVVKNGYVYWITIDNLTESPCLLGMPAFFHNMFSWKCVSSKWNDKEIVEERSLLKVAKFSPEFKTLEGTEPSLPGWQQEHLVNYAKDDRAVYHYFSKLDGADPKDFSVIFPFGTNKIWQRFELSQSAGSTYFGRKKFKYVNFSELNLFTDVRCPGHGLSCLSISHMKEAHDYERHPSMLGWIGNDVILLRYDGITYFTNSLSPDTFTFSTRYGHYIYTNKKFYELHRSEEGLFDMDVEYYESLNKW